MQRSPIPRYAVFFAKEEPLHWSNSAASGKRAVNTNALQAISPLFPETECLAAKGSAQQSAA